MAISITALVRAMRPRHWLKNGFVFAPALFSGHIFDPPALLRVAAAAACFCLISSAVYLVNDVLDRDADRSDPVKSRRPIAAGLIPPAHALAAAALLSVGSLAGAAVLDGGTATAVAAYALLNVLYSIGLKTVPVLEAMVLASGFVLRLVGGALVIDVLISHWLLICGGLLATLLAFAKRVPEIEHPTARTPRYPASFLTEAVTLLAGVTMIAYILYTVAPETVVKFHTHGLLVTAPVVLFGILRYLFLLAREGAQDPTVTLLSDRPLLAAVVLWALLAGTIIFLAGRSA